jgi:hypothetical protein
MIKSMKKVKSISLLLAYFALGLILVIAGSYYLTFQANAQKTNVWDFAARVMPDALSQQVKRESLDPDWIGDPRRFTAVKYSKDGSEFYLVWTNTDCPREGVCDPLYHRPTCGATGYCQFVGYAKRGDHYGQVFATYVAQQLPFAKGFSSISDKWISGVPECLTLVGIDTESPKQKGDGIGRVTYCYSQVEGKFKYRETKFEKFPANQQR